MFLLVFSFLVVVFILESLSRAEAIENGPSDGKRSQGLQYIFIPDNSQHNNVPNTDNKRNGFEIESNEANHLLVRPQKLLVKNTIFEIPELADMFLGKYGKISYTVLISVYLFSTLWAYTTVFALAFSTHVDIGTYSYQIYVVIFSLFVVPMSLMEFKEQICIQVFLSVCRVVMVSLMIGTVLYARYTGSTLFDDFTPDLAATESEFSIAHIKGIYLLLPIAAYANIFHHSIPSLCQLVPDKSSLNGVFFVALFIAMVCYTTLGSVVSSYFGPKTMISSNLNWTDFHGASGSNGAASNFANLLAGFVVLFPAFDVASAFPLNAITLANNLMSYYDGEKVHENENSRLHRIIFRVGTVLPAITCAFFFSNLGEVTHFAGLSGFAIGFVYPALLAYYSHKKVQDLGITTESAYSFKSLSVSSNIATAVVGLWLIVFVGYCLITIGPVG